MERGPSNAEPTCAGAVFKAFKEQIVLTIIFKAGRQKKECAFECVCVCVCVCVEGGGVVKATIEAGRVRDREREIERGHTRTVELTAYLRLEIPNLDRGFKRRKIESRNGRAKRFAS